jgi:hypothetical protein
LCFWFALSGDSGLSREVERRFFATHPGET